MLKQLKAELECFKRKIGNLEGAIETGDIAQIEIEFANVSENFLHLENEIESISEEIEQVEDTLFDSEILVPIHIVIES